MRNNRAVMHCAAILVAAQIPTTSANAQQTPENAHRFLGIATENADFFDHRLDARVDFIGEYQTLDGRTWNGPSARETAELRDRAQRYIVSGYTSSDLCRSSLVLAASAVTYTSPTLNHYANHTIYQTRPVSAPVREAHQRRLDLDWSKVSGARAEGPSVHIATSQAVESGYWYNGLTESREVEFRLADADLATRAAFAAQFLRLHCDPAADTGF
jgi:hypothetical protein